MSGRNNDHCKGSSRSGRDDSRHESWHRREKDRKKSRSRSRSPNVHKRRGESRRDDRSYKSREDKYNDKRSNSSSDEEVPAPPPPPRITKISIGFQKPGGPIKMSLGGQNKAKPAPKPTVASVFNTDDDDEPEEMPAEARMRMRNIGRETPTSAGPNSFGKTKQGFCDSKKVFEKNLKQALETADKPATSAKFPQTIYRINGP